MNLFHRLDFVDRGVLSVDDVNMSGPGISSAMTFVMCACHLLFESINRHVYDRGRDIILLIIRAPFVVNWDI